MGLNDLEQYGRGNSLRFHNLDMDLSLKEGEMIHSMAGFINTTILANEENISDRDIERCHPISKKVGTRKPQIIVKFTSYKTRAKVYANKTKLKGHPDKTFLTEDLTSKNHSVIKSLLELRKAKRINSFWTSNGKILAKVTHRSVHRVDYNLPRILNTCSRGAAHSVTQWLNDACYMYLYQKLYVSYPQPPFMLGRKLS